MMKLTPDEIKAACAGHSPYWGQGFVAGVDLSTAQTAWKIVAWMKQQSDKWDANVPVWALEDYLVNEGIVRPKG